MDERAIAARREHIAKRAFSAIEVVGFERVHAFGEAVRQPRREILRETGGGSESREQEGEAEEGPDTHRGIKEKGTAPG